MWLPLTLLVLAGTVSADYEHGWKIGNEYTYLVRSRTLASLGKLSDVHTGILTKATLTVQAKDPNRLIAKLWDAQHAQIHKSLPEGWDSKISDQMLELKRLPITDKPFEIKLKHGVIRDIIVDRGMPTWEVNMLKSIVGQLQVDSQGENSIKSIDVQVPSDEQPYGTFRVMEDSVGGRCEVQYDILPLTNQALQANPEQVPHPELKGDGHHIEILKTKNFDKCVQRMNYHFGINGGDTWEPGSNANGKFITKSSTSRIIISGTLKTFTIQSSVTTSKVYVNPRMYDEQNGMVVSKMKLILQSVKDISSPLSLLNNAESTGNLVYVYNNPFSDTEERRITKKTETLNSNQILNSDSISSVSSSEEATEKGQLIQRLSSSSSSSSSSSISSSEENDFWQPKPTLEDAPQNPLLPNFIGYKGKFIGQSNNLNIVSATKELIFEVANELEDPSNIPTQETLDKFTILCSLIRTMNRKQISDVESSMHFTRDELKSTDGSQAVKQNAWAVFRDAIIQAGTGPAFLTIKRWIEKSNIGYLEAADALSRIPLTARTPTAQYIKAFFELIQTPEVKQQPLLNTTGIMAFAELVRQSQVDSDSIHNLYPVHTFGRLTPKHDQAVKEEYIPYLGRELNNAIEKEDSQKIQTYIMALGTIGHPKILTIFEPYLEGKKQVTTFQRTLMVAGLSKLAESNPKLARSVLYKIYLNTMENHEVRCTAVFLLMKTNPPLNMLQRMADFTNYDTNKHVNSAVKSTLESMAELTSPEWQELAKKARAAQTLLTPSNFSYQYSHGFLTDKVNNERNWILQMILNYVGSDESVIPCAMYLGWFSSYGDFKIPPTELLAMISSIRSLSEVQLLFKDNQEVIKTIAEKIVEELNIIPDQPVPLEGNLMLKSKFLSRFVPFDRNSIHGLSNLISKYALAMKEGGNMNMNKLMSYDVTVSFPTETGLPFVYTFRLPTLYKISGNSQITVGSGLNIESKSSLRLVYSKKIQGRVGFVTPFEHRHYIAGIDLNFQTYAPVKLVLELNVPMNKFQLKLWPLKSERKTQLLHYSVLPYTSSHDILRLRPVLKEKNTHLAKPEQVETETIPRNDHVIQLIIKSGRSDNIWDTDLDGILEVLQSPWTMDNDKYREVDLQINLESEQQDPIIFGIAYDTLNAGPNEQLERWISEAKIVEPTNKELNSKARRQQLMKEVIKGIKLVKANAVDIGLQFPGEVESRSVLTLAWSESEAESNEQALLYWRLDIPGVNVGEEACAAWKSTMSPDDVFYYDQAIRSNIKVNFNLDVKFGKSCSNGEQVHINGISSQSMTLKERIKNSILAKECEEQITQGNMFLHACHQATALAKTVDYTELTVNSVSKNLRETINTFLAMLGNSNWLDATIEYANLKNAGSDNIDINTRVWTDSNTADLTVYTPSMNLRVKGMSATLLGLDLEDVLNTADKKLGLDTLVDNEDESSCVLDSTRAETFDLKQYPLRLGNCWHVVLTRIPDMSSDKPDEKLRIPNDRKMTILCREIQNGKELKVLFGDHEINVIPTDSSQLQVLVDGVRVDTHQEVQSDGQVAFEIFRKKKHNIIIYSSMYEANLLFDGKRLWIQASTSYRNSLRGLCGNYDGDSNNDFTGPRSCTLRKPELFIASYALTKEQCEGESLENAKSIQNYDCTRETLNRQSNVISDLESGRAGTENGNWGYHQTEKTGQKQCGTHRTQVFEIDNELCFTIRPVVTCAPGCSATENKSKKYQLHCMERNEASLNLKKRIEKGANPDLSQKPVSRSRLINVPIDCRA